MLSRQLQTIPEPGFYMCALSTVMPINGKNLQAYNTTVEAYKDSQGPTIVCGDQGFWSHFFKPRLHDTTG